MINVYIVCGAGASSTFLAVKLRSLSQRLGHNLQFLPAALETVQPAAGDILVVASHIAEAAKVANFCDQDVTVITLPKPAQAAFDAEEALKLIERVL